MRRLGTGDGGGHRRWKKMGAAGPIARPASLLILAVLEFEGARDAQSSDSVLACPSRLPTARGALVGPIAYDPENDRRVANPFMEQDNGQEAIRREHEP